MIKILVLDDEAEMCEGLKEFFSYRGYEIIGALTGEMAIEKIQRERPQILLLDIKMEGTNGLDVLKFAKENDSEVKAIMITALKDEDVKAEALKLGADEYVVKPFSYDQLEGLIAKMINTVNHPER